MDSLLSDNELLKRIQDGDQDAAAMLFSRYSRRLIGLARKRLSDELKSKIDSEDVMQSVFRTFFRRQNDGHFLIADSESLWGLLAIITVRKCGEWADYYSAQCRDIRRETVLLPTGDESIAGWQLIAKEPTTSQALILTETLAVVMDDFDQKEKEIVTMALQGYDTREIGSAISRSERTVRRILDRFRVRLGGIMSGNELT